MSPSAPATHVCANCHSRVHDYHSITWWWLIPVSLPLLVIALHDRNLMFLLIGVVIILASVTGLLAWQFMTNLCPHCGSRDIVPVDRPPGIPPA